MVVKLPYEMQIPKEGKEIIDALEGLVKHFVAKKPIAEAALLLPAVMTAVDGYDKVGEELKSDGQDELAGYLVHKLLGALKAPVVPAVKPV